MIEVGEGQGEWALGDRIVLGWLEGAGTCAQQYRDVGGIVIRSDHISLAVVVEVGDAQPERQWPRREIRETAEDAIAIAEENRYNVMIETRDCQIGLAVSVEIA